MPKATTVYLDDHLKDRVRVIARSRGRKVSPQIVRWVERMVERIEKKDLNPSSRGRSFIRKGRTCRA